MPQLFQPYTRLGQKGSAGLGLGLYLAREIVTAHGGTIEADLCLRRGHDHHRPAAAGQSQADAVRGGGPE
jgi:K+-sensing histidine kinase KdpD